MYPEKLDTQGFPKQSSTAQKGTILSAYNGTRIPQYGAISIQCSYRGNATKAEFYVADSQGPAILGLPTCTHLQVVQLNCVIDKTPVCATSIEPINSKEDLLRLYPDRFEGIGNFKGTAHITIDKSVPPVIHAPRKCPIHLKDDIKRELDEMEQLGVITSVTEPTDWVSSVVYTRKSSGRLRVCLDPKDLNKAIKRPHYKTPTLEEITHKFAGATVFSKLDARHGYWSVSLDEESSMLTTFNSPFGRYCFNRLPFGLSLSQDIFQQKMDLILESCPGTAGIADDVAVIGENRAEHDRNLHNLFKVAREHGLVFNVDKCEISKPSIVFFGLVFSAQGVQADPSKAKDVQQMPAPTDTKQLMEFLGIATYMSPFIPHLSQHTAPLRDLLKKGTTYRWNKSHQAAFEKVIKLICREVTLSYFDPQQATVLQVDASSKGLGAVLIQNERPIAFASKSLSDCEQRYANIERELLAVVFGCEKFHTYLYGKQFTVESDHKPLEMIHLKNISAAPQRLQRMLLRIQHYNLRIIYKPGKEVMLADALSRTPGEESETIDLDIKVDLVQFSTQKQAELRKATREDNELRTLTDIIVQGWPDRHKQVPLPVRQYWSYRDELTVEDGIIMKGECVIISAVMQKYILTKLHESHQGIEKTKLRARTCVFWNNFNADIENLIKQCSTCQQSQKAQRPEPLNQYEIPTRPWQVVGTDLFYLDGNEYILICDYYSKFPIVIQIRGRATSDIVVNLIKHIFAEQGIPETVVSDNGPQYDSHVFKQFAENWGFSHITSSPKFPQSNGFIERQVQSVKHTLSKAKSAGDDPEMALLILRSTPVDCHLPSPSELLNSRKIRANLPTKIHNNVPDKDAIAQRLQERQTTQKLYHDGKAGESLAPLIPGQFVRVQDETTRKWRPAIVTQKHSTPRSYEVQMPSGSTLRRNRRHIRETHEKFDLPTDESESIAPEPESTRPAEGKHVRFNTGTSHEPARASSVCANNSPKSDSDTQNRTRGGRLVKPPTKLDL
jgi:transposase InsO family protein